MWTKFAGVFFFLGSLSSVSADEFADDESIHEGYIVSFLLFSFTFKDSKLQDDCQALVQTMVEVMNDPNDPWRGWDEPVKECFDEAQKKIRLAYECGEKLEAVCLESFKGTDKHGEAVKLKGRFDSDFDNEVASGVVAPTARANFVFFLPAIVRGVKCS